VGNLGIQPSEFWTITPTELWWIYEAKIPEDQRLTPDEKWGSLYEMLD
tara:strand:+ start:8049 stop:8192 length:144 start_codon:yes stop_codon:yes gene_type:complete